MPKSQKEMVEVLKQEPLLHFKKFGTVSMLLAKPGERVDTIINGELETTNRTKRGDYIAKGPKGERYILSADKVKSRYRALKRAGFTTWGKYEAKGEAWGNKYKGNTILFKASLGETMTLNKGDYLFTTDPKGEKDIYRVEKTVFKETYRKA